MYSVDQLNYVFYMGLESHVLVTLALVARFLQVRRRAHIVQVALIYKVHWTGR